MYIENKVLERTLKNIEKYLAIKQIPQEISTLSPGIIVGEKHYPNISIGVLSPVKIIDKNLNPKSWVNHNYPIMRIATIRAAMIDGFSPRMYIKKRDNKLLSNIREIALSRKELDIELKIKGKPNYKPVIHLGVPPLGGSARIEKIWNSNPKVPRIVDKVVYDTDLDARNALITLNKRGIDEYYSMKLFSMGLLGKKINRKIVPTRWTITAIDDLLGKNLLKAIRGYEWIDKYYLFIGGLYGNQYLILFIPDQWSYELFESYLSRNDRVLSDYMTDHEGFFDRTTYAKNTEGGYYATRLSILRFLSNIKKQAKVLVVRIITPAYIFPLGVWVVREAVRKTLENKPITFNDLREALSFMDQYALKRFNVSLRNIFNNSRILKENQSRLERFI